MLESIHFIREQSVSKLDSKILDRITKDVSNGQTLATALGKFNKVFGNFTVNIIKAGERSGTLAQNLVYLAEELKKKEMLRKKIMSALLYPVIILFATVGITGFLTIYIFPKILPIFQGMHVELPLSTRMVMWLTNVLENYGIWIFVGLVLFVIAGALLIKHVVRVRYFYDGFIMRLPIIGKIIKDYNLTNTTRTMGLLLKSGTSLSEALLLTTETTENTQFKYALKHISHDILKGKNLAILFSKYPTLFPPMFSHMLAIGEKSGSLSETLIYLSEFYENEFEDRTKNLSSAIEPILMVIMGLMVGFIAISVITPIYEITSNLKR